MDNINPIFTEVDLLSLIDKTENTRSGHKDLNNRLALDFGWKEVNEPDVNGDNYTWHHPDFKFVLGSLSFTSHIYSALTLTTESHNVVIQKASMEVYKLFSLDKQPWPSTENYLEWLCRLIVFDVLQKRIYL